MPDSDARVRAQLVAAAVANELSADERRELADLAARDPSLLGEIADLQRLVTGFAASVPAWMDDSPSDLLRARIVGVTGATPATALAGLASEGRSSEGNAPGGHAPEGHPVVTHPRWRSLYLVVGAAACLALGAGVVLGAQALQPGPASGPPGTLGAVEQVAFDGEPVGVEVEGSVVAHTWGTETSLTIDGLAVGETFGVVLVDVRGDELQSGTFLGSSVTINCRMNAAVMRTDVASVEIQNAAGTTIATAALPEATS